VKTFFSLFLLLLAPLLRADDIVPHSSSPDGHLMILIDAKVEPPCYRLVDRKLKSLGSFPTDYEAAFPEMGPRSTVSWRKDGIFFVLEEHRNRYHGFVIIGKIGGKSPSFYRINPHTLMVSTHQDYVLAYPHFEGWLPKNQIAVSVTAGKYLDWHRYEYVLDANNLNEFPGSKKTWPRSHEEGQEATTPSFP